MRRSLRSVIRFSSNPVIPDPFNMAGLSQKLDNDPSSIPSDYRSRDISKSSSSRPVGNGDNIREKEKEAPLVYTSYENALRYNV